MISSDMVPAGYMAKLFFYEVLELQFDSGEWMRFEPEPSFGTDVSVPEAKVLEGTTS